MELGSLDLFDMHCHLGFCPHASRAARELDALGVGVFSNTVTPAEFAMQHVELDGASNVRVGAGLHPWWVGGDEALAASGSAPLAAAEVVGAGDLGLLREQIAAHRFVGEVGLDLPPRHISTSEAQAAAFAAVAKASAHAGGRVLSIHAVRSASEVLDALDAAGVFSADAGCSCILHWFSGSSDELVRARRLGCFFSVNPRMLEAKRGRAYVASIPLDRLMLETDLPSVAGEPLDAHDIRRRLEQTAAAIAQIRGQELEEVLEATAYNSRQLLSL